MCPTSKKPISVLQAVLPLDRLEILGIVPHYCTVFCVTVPIHAAVGVAVDGAIVECGEAGIVGTAAALVIGPSPTSRGTREGIGGLYHGQQLFHSDLISGITLGTESHGR